MLLQAQGVIQAYTAIGFRHARLPGGIHRFERDGVAMFHQEAREGSFDMQHVFDDARTRGLNELIDALFEVAWELRDYG